MGNGEVSISLDKKFKKKQAVGHTSFQDISIPKEVTKNIAPLELEKNCPEVLGCTCHRYMPSCERHSSFVSR